MILFGSKVMYSHNLKIFFSDTFVRDDVFVASLGSQRKFPAPTKFEQPSCNEPLQTPVRPPQTVSEAVSEQALSEGPRCEAPVAVEQLSYCLRGSRRYLRKADVRKASTRINGCAELQFYQNVSRRIRKRIPDTVCRGEDLRKEELQYETAAKPWDGLICSASLRWLSGR